MTILIISVKVSTCSNGEVFMDYGLELETGCKTHEYETASQIANIAGT
jgi:hypothetical protein